MYSGFSALLKGTWATGAIVVFVWSFFVPDDRPPECMLDYPFIINAFMMFWLFGSIAIAFGFIEDVSKWWKGRHQKNDHVSTYR